jgi:hypothetical protein
VLAILHRLLLLLLLLLSLLLLLLLLLLLVETVLAILLTARRYLIAVLHNRMTLRYLEILFHTTAAAAIMTACSCPSIDVS